MENLILRLWVIPPFNYKSTHSRVHIPLVYSVRLFGQMIVRLRKQHLKLFHFPHENLEFLFNTRSFRSKSGIVFASRTSITLFMQPHVESLALLLRQNSSVMFVIHIFTKVTTNVTRFYSKLCTHKRYEQHRMKPHCPALFHGLHTWFTHISQHMVQNSKGPGVNFFSFYIIIMTHPSD